MSLSMDFMFCIQMRLNKIWILFQDCLSLVIVEYALFRLVYCLAIVQINALRLWLLNDIIVIRRMIRSFISVNSRHSIPIQLHLNSCWQKERLQNVSAHFEYIYRIDSNFVLLSNMEFWLLEKSQCYRTKTKTICRYISQISCLFAKFSIWSGSNLSVSLENIFFKRELIFRLKYLNLLLNWIWN